MRRLALVLLVIAPGVAAADPFDAMPKSAAALATQVTTAFDGTDEDAALALTPDSSRDVLKKEIDDAGGLAVWRGTLSAWTATQDGRSWDVDDDSIRIVLTPGKKDWVVVSITAKVAPPPPPPSVKLAAVSVTGGTSSGIVKHVLRNSLAKIAVCNAPARKGSMKVRFTIETDGTVTHATARGVDKQIAKCVAAVAGGIQFPPPESKARVSAKLTFVASSG